MFCQSISLLFGCFLLVNGYPTSLKVHKFQDAICNSEGFPAHGYDEQNNNENPYNVIASSSSYSPGSEIQLTISGDEFFKGFFFQAFDKDTDNIIGSWIPNSESLFVEQCAAIFHTNHADKYSVTLTWKYTGDQSGDLYFKGTIIQSYSVFWINIVSPVL